MLVNCPSCGSENAAHRRYCRKCGRAMGASCPTCHFFNLSGDGCCGGCGTEIKRAEERQGAEAGGNDPLSDDMGLGEEDFQDLLREHPGPAAKAPPSAVPEDPPIESFFDESSSS